MLVSILFLKRQLTVVDFRTKTKQRKKKLNTIRAWTLRENETSDEQLLDDTSNVGYDDNGTEVVEEEEENEKHDLPLSSVG